MGWGSGKEEEQRACEKGAYDMRFSIDDSTGLVLRDLRNKGKPGVIRAIGAAIVCGYEELL